jgi:hypothetical protein
VIQLIELVKRILGKNAPTSTPPGIICAFPAFCDSGAPVAQPDPDR